MSWPACPPSLAVQALAVDCSILVSVTNCVGENCDPHEPYANFLMGRQDQAVLKAIANTVHLVVK